MSIQPNFEGTGMRAQDPYQPIAKPGMTLGEIAEAERSVRDAGDAEADKLADAVGEALAQDIPTATTRATSRRVMFERSIVKDRAEKREIQRRISIDQAKLRHINICLRSSEDALDGILVSEG